MNTANASAVNILVSARLIADYAIKEGALIDTNRSRSTCDHMGALLADSVLQAGLNYKTVVRPRISKILRTYPEKNVTSALLSIIKNNETASFLNWNHHQKVERFENLILFFNDNNIETTSDLMPKISNKNFTSEMQTIKGVGPKTVDYMGCLIGFDSIAVDRHIKKFAKTVGVNSDDYDFLRTTFCYAADLLSLPRRDFDAWVWQKTSTAPSAQQAFPF